MTPAPCVVCVVCHAPCPVISPTGCCPTCQAVADAVARAWGRLIRELDAAATRAADVSAGEDRA